MATATSFSEGIYPDLCLVGHYEGLFILRGRTAVLLMLKVVPIFILCIVGCSTRY